MARTRPTESTYAKLADPACSRCNGGASVAKVSATFGTTYQGICPCVAQLRLPKQPRVR
jgi:hypothetical protein